MARQRRELTREDYLTGNYGFTRADVVIVSVLGAPVRLWKALRRR